MTNYFSKHSSKLDELLRDTSELDPNKQKLLGQLASSILENANVLANCWAPARLTFYAHEENISSTLVEPLDAKTIEMLANVNITFKKVPDTQHHTVKVVFPLEYTIVAQKKAGNPFTPNILPILQACNKFARRANKNSAIYLLAKSLKTIANDAKEAAKNAQPSSKFVFTRSIPTILVNALSKTQKRNLENLGITFAELDETNTKVTMTFKAQS